MRMTAVTHNMTGVMRMTSIKDNELIHLNVGGVIYTTTRLTLTTYPNTMIGAMFNGNMSNTKDEHGRIFIDRDGELFKYVLNFLRSSTLSLPDGFKDYSSLLAEADFYQIQPLTDLVRNIIQEIDEEKKKEFEPDGMFLEVTERFCPYWNRFKTYIAGSWDENDTPLVLIDLLNIVFISEMLRSNVPTTQLTRLQCSARLRSKGWILQNTFLSSWGGDGKEGKEVIKDRWFLPHTVGVKNGCLKETEL
ncbi:unnamed protein product [Owenia fusiformis]|uniref:Uncharacterized protein n=1 Tax=Owenia fusiformis TaxID=6347 RepID=A0A8J1TZ96_OWEFU|nr:unnamed protein product [Owenia fusiformis]